MLVLKWMFGGPNADPGLHRDLSLALASCNSVTVQQPDNHTPPVLYRGPDTSFLCDVNRPSSENI